MSNHNLFHFAVFEYNMCSLAKISKVLEIAVFPGTTPLQSTVGSLFGQVVPGKDIWKYIHGKHLWLIFWSGSSALFFGAKCGCGLFLKATAAVETRFEDGNGREENSSSLLSIADCSCVVCTEKGEEELFSKKAWIWKPMEVEVTGSC